MRVRHTLHEDTRFRVLRLLSENPHMSQRDLAEAVGISVGSAHYVLSALIGAGLLKLDKFAASPDRRRYAYVLTPAGLSQQAEAAARFVSRKLAEYEALRAEIEGLAVEFGLEVEPGFGGEPGVGAMPAARSTPPKGGAV